MQLLFNGKILEIEHVLCTFLMYLGALISLELFFTFERDY